MVEVVGSGSAEHYSITTRPNTSLSAAGRLRVLSCITLLTQRGAPASRLSADIATGKDHVIPLCILVSLVAGGIWAGLVASSIPNVRLKGFEPQLAAGKVLMMVLVPFHRAQEIRTLVAKKHPEALYSGAWPSDHAVFP